MRFHVHPRSRRGTWPIRLMCRVLQVSASGYYAWRDRPDSARLVANRHLLGDVRRLQAEHRGRYGSPRMHAALRAEGRTVSRGRVARLMRHHGIRGLAGRRFKPCTTDSRHDLPIAPNLLKQAFAATAPNTVWLADITYITTGEGWLYLAAVLDLATRKDRQLDKRCAITMRTELPARRADDGRATSTPSGRAHPTFGSRQPIRRRGLPKAARRHEGDALHEPHGLLL